MNKKDFTRNRKLPFSKMILTLMQKSIKSVQSALNETQIKISQLLGDDLKTISNSAYTQARDKLNFTAFIELSNDICSMFYKDKNYKRYKGFRLLAIDGSIITLPNTNDIKKEFSSSKVLNQYTQKQIVQARVSVLYDVLNNIAIDTNINDNNIGEITIVKNTHLKTINKDDLIIFDRGYPSYEMFALISNKYNANYIVRTKRNIYKEISFLFNKTSKIKDTIITLKPSTKKLKENLINDNLPCELKVRFVQVILDNGEVEVLATSILDDNVISTYEFKELYFKRWKIETYYDILKNRLSLENFTGLSALSIKQDFYASIFISNLESIITSNIDEQLSNTSIKNNNKYKQKVNKSVSFNIIKNYCLELFYTQEDIEIIFEKMYQLFQTSKVPIRPNRHFKRPTPKEVKHTKDNKSSNYQKRKKKIVF